MTIILGLNHIKQPKLTIVHLVSYKNSSSLTVPLFDLLTSSLNTSIILKEWKVHKIIPIYKSSDKTSVKFLFHVYKVPIYANMIIGSVSKCVIPYQSGFKRNTTITALILSASKDKVNIFNIDFRKSFDRARVPLKISVKTLEYRHQWQSLEVVSIISKL